MTKYVDDERYIFLVQRHPKSKDLYVRTDPGYVGSVLFHPFDGSPAILLAEDDIEVNGKFKNIDGDWYFHYDIQGEYGYIDVVGRVFVHYPEPHVPWVW